VEIKVLDQYIYSEVVGRAGTAVDTLLKARDYGASMPRKEYYDSLDIEGIDYVNITITNRQWGINVASVSVINEETPPDVDSKGNLFISADMVISKGTITLSEITT